MTYIFMFGGFCLVVYGRYIYKKIKRKNNQINISENPQKTYEIHQIIGIVQPAEEIEIIPYISGFVEKVCVKRGQMVEAGERLLQIGQRPYIVAKETSYAHLQSAKQHLKAVQIYCQRLNDKTDEELSPDERQKVEEACVLAQKKVNVALAKYEQAFKNYTYTNLKAPVKGLIIQMNVSLKNYVSPAGKALFRIVNKSSVIVQCHIPDILYKELMNKTQNLMTVQLVVSENPPCIYTGVFKSAESNPDSSKSELTVYFEFPNPDDKLREGDKLNIRLIQEVLQREPLVLPKKNMFLAFYPTITSFCFKGNLSFIKKYHLHKQNLTRRM